MIDQSRDITPRASVKIVPPVQIKNVDAVVAALAPAREPLRFPPHRLRLRDALARIFDHPRAIRNRLPRIHAPTVDGRLPVGDPTGVHGASLRCPSDGFQTGNGAPISRSLNPHLLAPHL